MDRNADATLYSDEGIFFCPGSSRKYFVEGYNEGVEPEKQSPIIDIDRDFPDQDRIPSFNKILLIRPDKDLADIFLSDPELVLISSGPDLYDVMCSGVSKGNSLLELADYLNIPSDNTFAIGDSDNDLSMIESAKYGIAVGNATEEIKKAASYISADYNSLGFAKAVYDFVIPLTEKFS